MTPPKPEKPKAHRLCDLLAVPGKKRSTLEERFKAKRAGK